MWDIPIESSIYAGGREARKKTPLSFCTFLVGFSRCILVPVIWISFQVARSIAAIAAIGLDAGTSPGAVSFEVSAGLKGSLRWAGQRQLAIALPSIPRLRNVRHQVIVRLFQTKKGHPMGGPFFI
ncbi:hypothetical protein [Microbulbifer taiwanensis]|uniref:hypothetical protein n=1 Tax=Microbulbifer taiwanensis TaxID=986746 RepID=UPI00360AC401